MECPATTQRLRVCSADLLTFMHANKRNSVLYTFVLSLWNALKSNKVTQREENKRKSILKRPNLFTIFMLFYITSIPNAILSIHIEMAFSICFFFSRFILLLFNLFELFYLKTKVTQCVNVSYYFFGVKNVTKNNEQVNKLMIIS